MPKSRESGLLIKTPISNPFLFCLTFFPYQSLNDNIIVETRAIESVPNNIPIMSVNTDTIVITPAENWQNNPIIGYAHIPLNNGDNTTTNVAIQNTIPVTKATPKALFNESEDAFFIINSAKNIIAATT